MIHDPIRHDGWNRRDLGPEWVYHQRLSLNFQYLLKKLEKFTETIAISSFSEILQLSYEPVIRTRHNSPSTLSSFDVELLVIYENEHLQHPKKLLSSYHCCSCCVKVEAASACKHWVTDWHSVGCAHGCLAFSLNPHEAMINLISCNFLMNKLASGRCSASTKIALWSRSCFVGPKTPAPTTVTWGSLIPLQWKLQRGQCAIQTKLKYKGLGREYISCPFRRLGKHGHALLGCFSWPRSAAVCTTVFVQ